MESPLDCMKKKLILWKYQTQSILAFWWSRLRLSNMSNVKLVDILISLVENPFLVSFGLLKLKFWTQRTHTHTYISLLFLESPVPVLRGWRGRYNSKFTIPWQLLNKILYLQDQKGKIIGHYYGPCLMLFLSHGIQPQGKDKQ